MEKPNRRKAPKKGKAKMINVDANAPKKPLTAYFWYMKERRESLKKEEPTLSNTGIVSKMSEEWKKLDKEAQSKYIKLAEDDKRRYEIDMREYNKKESTKAKTHESSSDYD